MDSLDGQTQSCTYLPPEEDENEDSLLSSQRLHASRWRDLPYGCDLRMQEYKKAWSKCLGRMQSLARATHAPIAAQISQEIKSAYSDTLPGLPYPELPVITLTAEAGSPIYADVVSRLEMLQDPDNQATHALQAHLHPADCPSLLSMMKAIIIGFTTQAAPQKNTRPAASLATYDFARLEAWYRTRDDRPHLVVFLHDFEQFDVAAVRDAFYICSLHVPRIPLVFVLGLTSPSTPTYLHKAYPQSTRALLRVRSFTAPSGHTVIDKVITETLFDPTFQPDVMIGPATLDFLRDFASRHTPSLDALYTILQLAHLKHFTEPLTVLAGTGVGLGGTLDLSHEDARPFVSALTARLQPSRALGKADDATDSANDAPEEILNSVDAARAAFHERARGLRIGFAAADIVRSVSRAATSAQDEDNTLQFASAVLRGRVEKDIRYMRSVVRKLSAEQLKAILQQLMLLLSVYAGEADSGGGILQATLAALTRSLEGGDGEIDADADLAMQETTRREIADELGDWLATFLEARFVRLDEGPLWDVWYMGNTPFPSELINPAPRLSVVSALMHPEDFVRAHAAHISVQDALPAFSSPSPHVDLAAQRDADTVTDADVYIDRVLEQPRDEGAEGKAPAIWQLPDVTILFRRYAEAGRMVNVYDWFQSFAVVLESQRRHLRRHEQREQGVGIEAQQHPVVVNGKTRGAGSLSEKGKGKQREALQSEIDGETDGTDNNGAVNEDTGEEDAMAEDTEEWREEVLARFMRALHTLDHMGFVRHTGRKADHIIRTVYDVLD